MQKRLFHSVIMKKILSLLSFFFISTAIAVAQTAPEIISRMEAEMNTHEKEGIVMTIDTKIPILGTVTVKSYALDKKMRMDADMMGVKVITWMDGETEWVYNSKSNTVEIKKGDATKKDESNDAEMFEDITDGYGVSIAKETADAWYILCKKSKTNKDKDAPKTMDLVVAKGTFYPKSLSTKVSGVTLTLRDISFGVNESQVTFDSKDFPGVTIEDKR